MDYAEYGRPGGKRVSPQEFIQLASPKFRERGILPYCAACGEPVDPYGVHTPGGATRFDHANRPEDANPLDDCILANRNKRFRGMQPESFDTVHGKQLRENFFQKENIKQTYCFMWTLCGRGCLPITSFISTIERASNKKIWDYSNIKLWCIPYILLTFENFTHPKGFEFHFFIDKKSTSYINDIWEKRIETKIVKVFPDGKVMTSPNFENPLIISEENYTKITEDYSWVKDTTINQVLTRFGVRA